MGDENLVLRLIIAIVVAAAVLFAAGCTVGTAHPAASRALLPADPRKQQGGADPPGS